jgi:PAS domain S-box-containing protein
LKQQNDALVEKQEALQKEQYLFSALLDNAKESIYFKDTESRFVRLSRSMMHLFKVKDLNELIGKSDFDFFDDEHARPAYDGEQEIIKTGKPIIDLIEKEVQKDGSVSWVNTSKMPLIDQDGNIVGTWGISKDISDFIRMEHEIKQRNEELLAQEEELRQNLEEMQTTQEEIERMRVAEKAMAEHVNQQNEALLEANKNLEFENIMFTTLMDNLAARVTYKDTEARHIRINETKVKALGIKDQSEIFGKTDPEVFGKTHTIERLNKEIQQIKKGEATVHKVELFIQKDGESHWGDTSRYPLKNKQGDIIGGLVITWDITDQKNIQSRLELMNLIMRNVSKDLPVILFNSTENGEIVEISGKALQLLGLKEEKTAGGKLQDLIPEIKKSFADAKEKDLFQSTGKVKSGKSEYHYKYLLIKSKATTGGFTGYIILENA